MRSYYDTRAPEYDDWWLGTGLFAQRERPGWAAEVAELTRVIGLLAPRRTLDVACGTGFLTRHLPGSVVGLDQSGRMIELTKARGAEIEVVQGDAVPLPFADGAFERVFTSHFYGHLLSGECERFVSEARRIADELVIVDAAARQDEPLDQWQERKLNDGSRHRVYKRFFDPESLAQELGGGEVIHAGDWFVVVRSGAAD
jgi:SAM-dependent methyltransferase